MYTGNSPIVGYTAADAYVLDAWLARMGRILAPSFAPDSTYKPPPAGVGAAILEFCALWGPDPYMVCAQISKESAGWQSKIARDKNNPSGLGAVNGNAYNGAVTFDTPREGVEATVAHLMVYAEGNGPWASKDPRYDAVRAAGWLGICDVWKDLNGRWAWPGDGYGESIAAQANQIVEFAGGQTPMAGDDVRFTWMPDVTEYGYPTGASGRGGHAIDLFIVHITAGTDSSAWLRGNNGSSTHYLTDRAFRPREQHVKESNAAWTAGNQVYNQRGINCEYETPANTPISDEQLRNAANTARPILVRKHLPFVYLGRDHGPGKRGIIAHSDVPDPDGSGWGGAGNHTDPGPYWNWDKFIGYLNEGYVPEPPEEDLILNGIPIVQGFKAEFLERGRSKYPEDEIAGGLSLFGYPLQAEYQTDFGTAQVFERVIMRWERANGRPFDVTMQLRSEVEPPPPLGAATSEAEAVE